MIKKNELLKNLILFAFVLIVCFLIIEVSLRIFFPVSEYLYEKNTFILDDDVGYLLSPNLNYDLKQLEFNVNLQTNQFGFRDPTFNLKNLDENTINILSIGDSFTFGYGVEENETFNSIIETNLNQITPTNIYSIGLGGYGTIQEIILSKKYIPTINPEYVIINFYVGNDIRNNYYFNKGRKWHLHKGHLVTTKYNSLSISQKIDLFFGKHLYTVKYIKATFGRNPALQKLYNKIRKTKEVEKGIAQFKKTYTDSEYEDFYITEKAILDYNDYLKSQKTPLLINIIPAKYQLAENLKNIQATSNNIDVNELDFNKPNNLLIDLCNNNANIECVDLTEEFKNKNPEELYFKVDGHWNRNGHALAGEILTIDIINRLKI